MNGRVFEWMLLSANRLAWLFGEPCLNGAALAEVDHLPCFTRMINDLKRECSGPACLDCYRIAWISGWGIYEAKSQFGGNLIVEIAYDQLKWTVGFQPENGIVTIACVSGATTVSNAAILVTICHGDPPTGVVRVRSGDLDDLKRGELFRIVAMLRRLKSCFSNEGEQVALTLLSEGDGCAASSFWQEVVRRL